MADRQGRQEKSRVNCLRHNMQSNARRISGRSFELPTRKSYELLVVTMYNAFGTWAGFGVNNDL